MQDGHKTRVDLNEGSSYGERTVSYVPEQSYQGDRQKELENLRKQVNDLEIELKGQHCRRKQDDLFVDLDYISGASSQGSGSHNSRERSYETTKWRSESRCHVRHGHYNAALNALSRALRRVARSSFFEQIERIEMLRWFTLPLFIIYDGKTDPIEHVSHYIQIMSLYSHNDRYSRLVLAQLLRDGLTD